jgi:DNA-binding NarL/FixJ family response regulator
MAHVVVVDDHPAVRAGIEAFLEAEQDLIVMAAVETATEAEAACAEHRPDVLVADYHLPDGDGLTLCLRVSGSGGPRVVLFSAFADERLDLLALVAGARAVLPKSVDPQELVVAVRGVASGRSPAPSVSPAALQAAGRRLDPSDVPVLGMLAHGVEAAEMARALEIEEHELLARRIDMLERLRGRRRRRVWPWRGGRRVSAA